MKRRILTGIGFAGAAVLAIPAAVLAQTPPEPPATYWGNATGATAGERVIALVFSGGSGVACGAGTVTTFEGNTVYVVDVAANSQSAGCGQSGRTVRFYFPGSGATPARFATESPTWSEAGPKNQPLNVSGGVSLTVKRIAPLVASDGTY